MFDDTFYLKLVNEEFADSLLAKLKPSDLKSRVPRILVRLDEHFAKKPLKGGTKFNHYRPARFLAERVFTLSIADSTLDRFETAFNAANTLLKSRGPR